MTIDYLSFPLSSLRRVVHPGQQVSDPPHKYNNVAWGIPRELLSRYYRPAKANGDPEWWLAPDHEAWSDLLPYQAALRLYTSQYNYGSIPPKDSLAYELKRKAEERRRAIEDYWTAVRALPGGDDPLWRYTIGPEDEDLHRFVMRDDSRPDKAPWFPRLQLLVKYGTADLRVFAARNGVVWPG